MASSLGDPWGGPRRLAQLVQSSARPLGTRFPPGKGGSNVGEAGLKAETTRVALCRTFLWQKSPFFPAEKLGMSLK